MAGMSIDQFKVNQKYRMAACTETESPVVTLRDDGLVEVSSMSHRDSFAVMTRYEFTALTSAWGQKSFVEV